jgi:hypothetical protein
MVTQRLLKGRVRERSAVHVDDEAVLPGAIDADVFSNGLEHRVGRGDGADGCPS